MRQIYSELAAKVSVTAPPEQHLIIESVTHSSPASMFSAYFISNGNLFLLRHSHETPSQSFNRISIPSQAAQQIGLGSLTHVVASGHRGQSVVTLTSTGLLSVFPRTLLAGRTETISTVRVPGAFSLISGIDALNPPESPVPEFVLLLTSTDECTMAILVDVPECRVVSRVAVGATVSAQVHSTNQWLLTGPVGGVLFEVRDRALRPVSAFGYGLQPDIHFAEAGVVAGIVQDGSPSLSLRGSIVSGNYVLSVGSAPTVWQSTLGPCVGITPIQRLTNSQKLKYLAEVIPLPIAAINQLNVEDFRAWIEGGGEPPELVLQCAEIALVHAISLTLPCSPLTILAATYGACQLADALFQRSLRASYQQDCEQLAKEFHESVRTECVRHAGDMLDPSVDSMPTTPLGRLILDMANRHVENNQIVIRLVRYANQAALAQSGAASMPPPSPAFDAILSMDSARPSTLFRSLYDETSMREYVVENGSVPSANNPLMSEGGYQFWPELTDQCATVHTIPYESRSGQPGIQPLCALPAAPLAIVILPGTQYLCILSQNHIIILAA